MRLLLIAAASVLAGVPLAARAQTAPAPARDSVLANDLRGLIMTRLASVARGDSAAYHRLIDPAYVNENEGGFRQSGPALLRAVAANRPDSANPTVPPQYTVTEVHTRPVGPLLLVDALVTQQFHVGAGVLPSRWRETNALVRVGGQWRFAQHSETPIVGLGGYPAAATPDSAALAAFVGDYEWWPGFVDRVTQRGAQLYGEDPDHPEEPPHPLVAAGAEAFYPDGDSSGLAVFARDATGRVTHYVTRVAGGPVVVARKVR